MAAGRAAREEGLTDDTEPTGPRERDMKRRLRWGAVVVVLVIALNGAGFAWAQPSEAAPLDEWVQGLVDQRILLGAPDGDLQLDRRIQKGEFLTMIERVLRLPLSAEQHLDAAPSDDEPDNWARGYAWSRRVWDRVLAVQMQVRHLWFDLRYLRAETRPWGLPRNHWMSASLQHAYLQGKLIDLSFEPMTSMDAGEAIDLVLTAAGYGGEVAAILDQMPSASRDEARSIVCRLHGMERMMEYTGQTLTRGDAALMIWLLMEQRIGRL
jgi:hypothetical protein